MSKPPQAPDFDAGLDGAVLRRMGAWGKAILIAVALAIGSIATSGYYVGGWMRELTIRLDGLSKHDIAIDKQLAETRELQTIISRQVDSNTLNRFTQEDWDTAVRIYAGTRLPWMREIRREQGK